VHYYIKGLKTCDTTPYFGNVTHQVVFDQEFIKA